jgi:hypothetical protein
LDNCIIVSSGNQWRDVDFEQISKDVRHALKYACGSKYAIRTPHMKADLDVGALISQGLVPPSLHREVRLDNPSQLGDLCNC